MVELLTPPKDPEQLADAAAEIVTAARRFGRGVDMEGFLSAWMATTRVVARKNDEGMITGLCFFAAGKQWPTGDITAHLLLLEGETDGMLEHVKMLSRAIGATGLFEELPEPLEDHADHRIHGVKEHKL